MTSEYGVSIGLSWPMFMRQDALRIALAWVAPAVPRSVRYRTDLDPQRRTLSVHSKLSRQAGASIFYPQPGAVMTTRRWVDWVNVILGLWLMASPWLLPVTAGDRTATWVSWSVGVGIVTLACFAMYKPAIWASVVGILFGVWLMASPWMLELANLSPAATNALIVGALVIGYAAWAMRIDLAALAMLTARMSSKIRGRDGSAVS